MTKEFLKDYIKKNFFTSIGSIKSNFTKQDEIYLIELDKYIFFSRSIPEKIYLFLNNMTEPPKCANENCNNYVNFKRYKNPYTKYCSRKCMSSSLEVKKNRKKTCLEKYGSENCFSSNICKEKIEKTNIEKYGCKNPRWSEEGRNKANKTNIEKYGCVNVSQNKNIRQKVIETNMKKFGFSTNLKSEDTKIKIRKTNLKKYGNEIASKSKKIKDKTKKSNLETYGVEFFTKSEAWKNKFDQTKFQKALIKYSKYVEPLFSFEDWKNRKSPYDLLKWRCKKCDNVFYAPLCNGVIPRCTNCYPISKSKFEDEVYDFISSFVDAEKNNRTVLNGKELDIYIKDRNLAIECDGVYWHSTIYKDKYYHLRKTEECRKKGIHLIHIFENEWHSKQNIVKSILLTNLGMSKKIGARKCIVRCPLKEEEKEFFDKNHLQGYVASSYSVGLYYEDILISCVSYGKPRFNKNYDWELLRFASLLNTSVIGGFSKLWKYKPKGSIITYSDKRYFTGDIYKNYFEQLEDTSISYYYVKDNNLFSRFTFQKKKLLSKLKIYDASLTEKENMQLNGYLIIYDCGNFKFELKQTI